MASFHEAGARALEFSPGIYEQVDSLGAWTGFQHCLSAGEALPAPPTGHAWVCIDLLRQYALRPWPSHLPSWIEAHK